MREGKGSEKLKWYEKPIIFGLETGMDFCSIIRRVPGGFYSAINFKDWEGKLREKLLPQKLNGLIDNILGIKEIEVETM